MSDSGSWVTGQFSTRKIPAREIAGFWEAVDAKVPVIVAGDFNEGADGRAVQFLANKGMRSALAQVKPKADTWHWPLKGWGVVLDAGPHRLRRAAVVAAR